MRIAIYTVALGLIVGSGAARAQPPAEQTAGSLPDGATFAFIDIARVASESTEGQASNVQIEELTQQKMAELEAANTQAQGRVNALNQQLLETQQKLQQGQNVISQEAAASLQREVGRLQLEVQRETQDSQATLERMSQDADAEVQGLQQELQTAFEQRVIPAIDQIAVEKGLSFIFSASQGLIWADPSLDLTQEIVDRLNSQAATTP